MIPGDFDYFAPPTIEEAVQILSENEADAKILAGGQSLIPAMRYRLSLPSILIDINGLSNMSHVRADNGHLAIGAMARESQLESSELVQTQFPLLADAAFVIADPIVRNMATVGGNIVHADPANDHPAVMLAYNAVATAVGPNGRRDIAIDDFFVDFFESALASDEILTEIRIPRLSEGDTGAYIKFERKVGDYAISATAVQMKLDGDTCVSARVGLTNVNPVPMRSLEAEKILIGNKLTDEVIEEAGRAAAAECDPAADLRGSVDYKRDMTRVLLKRAIRKSIERAQ